MKILNIVASFLKRDTGKKKLIPEIDGLRTLALLPVILMHFNTNYKRYLGVQLEETFDNAIDNGERGVLLFFAISGFILSLGFYNILSKGGGIDYKNYLVRRLTRLEPPFIISILVLFVMVQFRFPGGWTALFDHLIPTLTYTHHLIFGYWSPINPVTWSLETEIQFYLLIPFFCLFLFTKSQRFRIVFLSILIILVPCVFLREGSYVLQNPHLKRSLLVFCSHFLVGLLFLNLYVSQFWLKVKPSYIWDCIGVLAILVFLIGDFGTSRLVEALVVDALILLILFSAFKGVFLNRLFRLQSIVIFGGMCYSIYLLHYSIIYGVSIVTKHFLIQNNLINYFVQFLLAFGCILVVCSIFFVLFEKPFMKKNWWKLGKDTRINSQNL
ncbi:acyltransferase [Sphingobacterium shayense]|uniref:acyltransferase family protein n=1 Tax=Sphingobacterium shayense TaxID=626343 RepID=UPI00155819DF|nr:acyltransferase [Sphingobacterium shayense]NQD70236.1 acyltransferase [Sphingobacterium shayense]